jgi:hypothetical protein
LSSLKIHRPRPGFNPRTLGLMASTLTRTPLRTTCIVNTLHFKISVSKGDGDVILGLTGFEVMYLVTYVSKECITVTLTMEVIRSSPARPHNVTTQKTAINTTCTIIITRYSHRKSCWVSSAVNVQTVPLCDIPLQSRVQEVYKYSSLSVLDRFLWNLVLVVHTKVCAKFNFCRFWFNIAVTNPGLEVRSCRNVRLLNSPNNHRAMLRCNCCCCCYGTVILCNKTFILYSSNFVVWQCTIATPELLPKLCSLLTWNSSHMASLSEKCPFFFCPPSFEIVQYVWCVCEPGISHYSVWLRAGRLSDRGSIPGRGEMIFPLASVSRPALGPAQPPVQWVPGVLSPGLKRGRGVTLTTRPHLVPRSNMSRSYTSSPQSALVVCSGTALYGVYYV